MAALVSIRIAQGPDYTERADSSEYKATWLVETDSWMPGGSVLALARLNGTNPVPQRGASFVFVAPGGSVTQAIGLYALDFDVKLRDPDKSRKLYSIDVTWRQPQPGNTAENPNQNQVPNPVDRPSEWWIEWAVGEEEVRKAKPVTNVASGTLGAEEFMKNSLNEPLPFINQATLKPVIVRQRNVDGPVVSLELNQRFENTTNNADWTIELSADAPDFSPVDFDSNDFQTARLTIKKHHARWIRSETGRRQEKDGYTYYQEQTRIEISRTPYYLYRENISNRFKVGSVYYQDIDEEGFVVPGPYRLTSTGNIARTVVDYAERPYLVLIEADYTQIR